MTGEQSELNEILDLSLIADVLQEVAKAMNIDWASKNYNLYDLYYVLNMERSDYFKANEAPQYYVDLAFDFLDDKDAPEGKAKRYYVAMHCAE